MGIEPTSEAWEASILPLYDARSLNNVAKADTGRKRRVGLGVSMAGMVMIRKRRTQTRRNDEEG
jgi:hypothetical protein